MNVVNPHTIAVVTQSVLTQMVATRVCVQVDILEKELYVAVSVVYVFFTYSTCSTTAKLNLR